MSPKRNEIIDVVRILACVFVVIIHLFYPVYSRPDFLGGATWWLAVMINSVAHVAVPWFVMISGFLLLPKSEPVITTYIKAAKRVLIPLIIWSAIYFWWDHTFFGQGITIDKVLSGVFSGGIYSLYYLFIILGLYIALPALKLLYKFIVKEHAFYIVGLVIVVGMIANYLEYFGNLGFSLINAFSWWILYAGYFLAGGLLNHFVVSEKWLITIIAIFCLSWFCTIYLEYLGVASVGRYDYTLWKNGVNYFDSFLSPNIVTLSICGFAILMSRLRLRLNSWMIKTTNVMAAITYSIYLVHPMIIDWIDRYTSLSINHMTTSLWPFLIVRSLISFGASVVFSLIIYYLPIIRLSIGEKWLPNKR